MDNLSTGNNPADVSDSLIDRLTDDFLERLRNGEQPLPDDYIARHPELADEIRATFPALAVMERAIESVPDTSGISHHEPPAPSAIGDFRIIREVGRGGMGIVYEAEQVSLGRRVALKVLPKQTLLDSKHQKRFLREAKAAARLHHTNIVPVFGVGQQEGLHYYVMQFIHGLGLDEVMVELQRLRDEGPGTGELGVEIKAARDVSAVAVAQSLVSGRFERTLLVESDSETSDQPSAISDQQAENAPAVPPLTTHHSPLTPPDTVVGQLSNTFPGHSEQTSKSSRQTYFHSVARIGLQAANALQYAHGQGIIHRDVKPANLLLDTRGSVWVTDFGLAKAADQQDLTNTGDVLGTLRYMAPEQFDGKADARSDVFSLGLTLYELLALKPAFDETDRHKLIKQVTTGAPPRLRTLDSHIPRDLETIVHKAIDRDPSHRYQTAEEVAADLQRYLGDEPIRARWISPVTRFARWCRRNPVVATLTSTTALLLVALTIGALAFAARVQSETRQRIALNREISDLLAEATDLKQLATIDGRRDPGAWAAVREVIARASALADSELADATLTRDVEQLQESIDATEHDEEWIGSLEEAILMVHQAQIDKEEMASLSARFAEAFQQLGLDPSSTTLTDARDRLAAWPESRRIVVLDAMVEWRTTLTDRKNEASNEARARLSDRLAAHATELDTDPWRQRLRSAVLDEDYEALQELAQSSELSTQSPASLAALGSALCQHPEHLDGGLRMLTWAQQRHPDNLWVNFRLADALLKAEPPRRGEAARFVTAAIALRPDSAQLWYLLGNCFSHDRQDEAITAYQRSYDLKPTGNAHYNLGCVLLRQGELDAAIAEFQHAIKVDGRGPKAHFNLGIAWRAKGDFDNAIQEFRNIIDGELRRHSAEFLGAHEQLGVTLSMQGKFEEAIAAFAERIELGFEDDSEAARVYDGLANAHRELRQWGEAIVASRRATGLDSSNPQTWMNLGKALFHANRLDEAESAFRQAMAQDSGDAWAHSLLGRVLQLQGKLDEAVTECEGAVRLEPDCAEFRVNLAGVLRKLGRLSDSRNEADRALELDPDLPQAHFQSGYVLLELQEYDAAAEALQRCTRFWPEDHQSFCLLGSALLGAALENAGQINPAEETKKFAGAADAFQRANELGACQRSLVDLGLCLYCQQEWDAAADAFRNAILFDPNIARAHHSLALVLLNQLRLDEAEASVRKAIELDPMNATPQGILEQILAARNASSADDENEPQTSRDSEKSALLPPPPPAARRTDEL